MDNPLNLNSSFYVHDVRMLEFQAKIESELRNKDMQIQDLKRDVAVLTQRVSQLNHDLVEMAKTMKDNQSYVHSHGTMLNTKRSSPLND